ncbi:SIMPL domain-containing protein [Candidatus Nomurabacteria bacterium]|nr:SIMPL domain-containing protein [Candidatus Kaiserbacteria bacterium]MCB9815203.1 SIMPL domain-containing protein [Candidatus Nomurabacteria bacterium]
MNDGFFNTKQMRFLGALTLLMALIALASYATLNFEKVDFLNPVPATISVSGEGEILAVPDVAQFSFSVDAEGDTASEAQELSGTKINEILAYLNEQSIEDKDVKTQNYSLYPKWRYEEKVCAFNSYCPPGERVQDGFEVTQTVSVKIRDTKTAGSIIAGVGERGATNISSLNFTVDDTDALKDKARELAIKDAKAKAYMLADQLGVRIIRIASYYEEGGYSEPYFQAKTMSYDMAEESVGFGGAEIPVGEDSTVVRVNLTYEVK